MRSGLAHAVGIVRVFDENTSTRMASACTHFKSFEQSPVVAGTAQSTDCGVPGAG